MKTWAIYALLAAVFISIRDIISIDFIKRYDFVQYIVIANIIIFVGTLIFMYVTDFELQIPNLKDFFIILIRVMIVYFIVDPSIYNSIKYCDNPGYAKSIVSLNTLFVFIIVAIIYKSKLDLKRIIGIIFMLLGSFFLV